MCLTLLSTLMLMTRDSKGKKSVTTDLLILTYGSSSKPSRESLICNRLRKDRKQNCNNNMPKYIIWTTVRTWSIAWPMFRCTCTVWHQNKILLALELNRCGHTEKQYRIVSILLVFDFCQSQNKPNTRAYMGWCKRGERSGLLTLELARIPKKYPEKKPGSTPEPPEYLHPKYDSRRGRCTLWIAQIKTLFFKDLGLFFPCEINSLIPEGYKAINRYK